MASRQEPLPSSASCLCLQRSACIPALPAASQHPARGRGPARRGARGDPPRWGGVGCGAGWSLPVWPEASRDLERGGSGGGTIGYCALISGDLGLGGGLDCESQTSAACFCPWTGSSARTQRAGVEVSARSSPWGVQSCPGTRGGGNDTPFCAPPPPPPSNGHDAPAVCCWGRQGLRRLPALCLAPDSALNLSLP